MEESRCTVKSFLFGGRMGITIEKIPAGFRIDGLEIKGGKCGCTSVLPCCHSWSKLKRNGDTFTFSGKATSPDTVDNFTWGYTVKKDACTVQVRMEDARDKSIFSGYYPPLLEEWIKKGWEVVDKDGEREDIGLWRCAACKWLFKEKNQGRKFESLPDDWTCPVCGVGKASFEKVG
jgi:rubredoxin